MKTRLIGGLAVLALVGLLPARASAQCNYYIPVIPDGRTISFVVPAATRVGYYFYGTRGHSYSVEMYAPILGNTFTAAIGDANVDCPPSNGQSVNLTNLIDPPAANNLRGSFTAPTDGALYMTQVANDNVPLNFYYSVSDTTLYSPAWTTNGTYNTFYSLLNTTNATCNGTLTLFNTAGVEVTSAPLSVPSGATASTNTQGLGTVRSTTGTARFAHDCPPGAFLAEAAIANFNVGPTPYFQFVHFQPTRESGR